MWIEREIQSSWNDVVNEYPVIVVTGSKQVGKTSLLETLYGSANLVSLDLPRLVGCS
jgi:predicted AAA+ superfamily ATPase